MVSRSRKTFGIVGGIGSLAGADLLFKLVKATPASDDSEHLNVILEQQPLREKTVPASVNYDPSARKLHVFNVIQNLLARKVDGILLSCFISHAFIDELSAAVDTPIVNMMEGIQNHVRDRHSKARKIGILTSDYVRKEKVFERYFADQEYELIYPDADVQERCLMAAVYGEEGIKAGHVTGRVIEYLEEACRHLAGKGVDLIIPGFTEIPVVLEALKKNQALCIVDTNQIYADWAIRHHTQAPKQKRYKVGIIGGLGPSATVDLMEKIIKHTPAGRDQDHLEMVLEHHPQTPDRTAHLLKGGEDPLIPLFTCAKKLENRGADFIVIPCNTAHAFVDRIQRHLQIPIISMIEAVVDFIEDRYPRTRMAGLLATSGTIATGIYHRAFEKTAIKLIFPNARYQQLVMEAIYGGEGIKAGFTQGKPEEYLRKAAGSLVRRGAQVLILGCTELPLVLEENDALLIEGKRVVILDPTAILARKCVNLASGNRK